MAVSLATAYVDILPSTAKLGKELSKQLTGTNSAVEKAGKSAGGKFSAALGKTLKVGAVATGAAVTGVLGTALTKGFQRLSAIDTAQKKLKGLGYSAKDTTKVMDSALAAVKGTAFGLGDAATLSAQVVAAGVKPGKELTGVLSSVANSAAAAGTDLNDMGGIYSKVIANGKASNGELQAVADRGIPIYAALGDQLGKTNAEVFDLASKGKISAKQFQDAMTKASGTVAKEMGTTVKGSFDNLMAAMGRLGAGFLSGTFPLIAPAIQAVTDKVDGLTKLAGPIGDALGKRLADGIKGLPGLFDRISGAISPVVTAFRDAFAPAITNVVEAFKPLGGQLLDAWQGFSPLSIVVKALTPLAPVLAKAFESVGTAVAQLVPPLAEAGRAVSDALVPTITDLVSSLLPPLVAAFVALVPVITAVATGAARFVQWISPALPILTKLALAVGAVVLGMKAYRTAMVAAKAVQATYTAVTLVGAKAVAGWRAAQVGATKAALLHTSATKAQTIAMRAGAIAQRVFNVVMKANPIMLVVAALSLLVAGVIYAYKHFGWFKTLVDGAWNGIKAATQAVVGWFKTYVWPTIQAVVDALGAAFSWFYNTIIKPVFAGIKIYVQTYITVVKAILNGVVMFVKNVLGPVFTWLYTYIVKPIFALIRVAVQIWWKSVQIIFKAVVLFVQKVLGPAFSWLWTNVIKPVFGWIGSKIAAWWGAAKIVFQAVSSFLKKTLGPAFSWLWSNVVKPVFGWIGDKISATWTFVRDKVFSPFKKGLGLLGDAFGKARDAIGKAWGKVQDIVKKPVKFVVETVINGGIIKGFNKIADFFKVGTIKPISLPKGFDTGGYTGPGRKYQPAGVVHADEFVLRKEATNRLRKRVGLSGLDYMNRTGNFPGFANGGLVKPVGNARVSSGFGSPRGKYPHAGIDFAVPIGTAVHAALAGVVQKAGRNIVSGRTGIGMLLSHEGGARHTYYGHLSRTIAKVGEAVTQGQVVARSGNTGNSSGPHLHFETWSGNTPVDPAKVLAGAGLAPGSGGTDSSGFLDTVLAPFKGISGLISKIPGAGAMKDAAVAGAKKALSIPVEWMKDKVGSVVDTVKDTASNIYNSAGVKVAKAGVKAAALKVGGPFSGWNTGASWDAINQIVSHESSWNTSAKNPKSSAFGLFQLLTSNRGGSMTTNPYSQGVMGLNYIKSRYGDPVKAWAFWQRHNWYANGGLVAPTLFDKGGALMPGTQLVSNQTRKPEYILPARVTDALISGDTTSGGPQVGVMNLYAQDPEDMVRLLERRDRRRQALAVI